MKNLIEKFDNKSGIIKLDEQVDKGKMDDLIQQIGLIFGANAADEGAYTGELTNCAENAVDELEIVIHSPGGSVLDGYTLYNEILAMRGRGVYVTATINTLAASMASVIAMAADKIRMVPTGRMMIHDVSQAVRGNADELTKAAKLCDNMSEQIAGIYAKRTGEDVATVRAAMKEETWMSADEALAKGYIDEQFDIGKKNLTNDSTMKLLAKLFPDNSEEIGKIEAQLGQIDSLSNDLSQAEATIASKDEEIKNLSSESALARNEVEALAADVVDKLSQIEALEKQVEEARALVVDSETVAAQKATEIIAEAGQEQPVDVSGDVVTKEPYAEYRELLRTDPVAASKFWDENLAPQSKL